MASDLVSRLSETLDELERLARSAAPGTWEYCEDDADGEIIGEGPQYQSIAFARSGNPREGVDRWDAQNATGRHIARWDPQAVLRLVEAHREILRLLETEERVHAEGPSPGSSHWAGGRRSALLNVVHALAKVWGITEEETA